jgi:hypothetical protein
LTRKKPLPEGLDLANVFTRQKVESLAAELGVSDEERVQELMYHLNSVASCYHGMRDIAHNTSYALARKKLRHLENKAEEPLRAVDDLDRTSWTLLRMEFRCRRGARDPKAWLLPETARRVLEKLHRAVRGALEDVPKGGGRPNNSPLHQACHQLVWLYEDFSDRKFAREKARGTRTRSADWVSRAARMIDPKMTDSELDTSLRYAVRDTDLRAQARRRISWVYEKPDD